MEFVLHGTSGVEESLRVAGVKEQEKHQRAADAHNVAAEAHKNEDPRAEKLTARAVNS